VLVDANKVLHELAQKKAGLMQDTFATPPSDYSGFMKAVGQYKTIVELEQQVRELARKQD
jgi:hypothetical protein